MTPSTNSETIRKRNRKNLETDVERNTRLTRKRELKRQKRDSESVIS